MSWAAPVAAIDARPGGVFEASYDATAHLGDDANIRNRIIALIPERLMAIQVAHAPPNFPNVAELRQLVTVIELTPADGGATRVRVSMFGYRDGEAYDALHRHFAWGNGWTLNKLHERIANGPIDWRAAQAETR